MTKRNKSIKEDAVSPVVGVMLMLVVTIIIAAVVSAFAGGLADSSDKTPQLVLTGKYSQENGMTITHASGDTVVFSAVNFMTTPSEIMGTDAAKFAWIINKTIILDPANEMEPVWNATNGVYNTQAFAPGDTLIVKNITDYTWPYTWPHDPSAYSDPCVNGNAKIFGGYSQGKQDYFGAYAFRNPANVGKNFYLDMVDSTGSVIARAVVTIKG